MTESNPFELPPSEPLLIVISGPSGVGKDSVIKCINERQLPLHFVVTATTRAQRPNERHGVDYFFHSPEEFDRMIRDGELLEYAWVYDHYKGIPRQQVRQALESGKDVIMRLDVQGAATIRHLCPDALLIYLTTRNEKELEHRLKERKGGETPKQLALRVKAARLEMMSLPIFDYIVTNPDCELDETVNIIMDIITAEHHRVRPRKVSL